METKTKRIVLHNETQGTSIVVMAKASLTHGTAKWDRAGDVRYNLTPSQAKRVRENLCPYVGCKGCILHCSPTCSDTGIEDKDFNVWLMDNGELNIYRKLPSGKEGLIHILMHRNGMSREDAERECDLFKEDMRYMMEQGYPIWQIEEEFTSYFGVEPDYMIDFI